MHLNRTISLDLAISPSNRFSLGVNAGTACFCGSSNPPQITPVDFSRPPNVLPAEVLHAYMEDGEI
jgi:hypothetical protein